MTSLIAMNVNNLGEGLPDRPAADRLISGDPRFTSWPLLDGDFMTGVWAATPGHHRVIREQSITEAFLVLEGEMELFEDGVADPRRFGPGDLVVLPPGFTGSWLTLSTVRKVYCAVQTTGEEK